MSASLPSPARRKRLLKAYGPCPAGYTHDDLERFLDLLYGLYSHVATSAELRQIVVSDPFDRREVPRCMKLVDLADWLEALLAEGDIFWQRASAYAILITTKEGKGIHDVRADRAHTTMEQ